MFLADERAFFDGLPAPTKAYFTQGRQLHDAIFRVLSPEITIGKEVNRRVTHTAIGLLAKGLKTFRGIELVAMAGLGGDAQALLR